ncbi:antibiotic resistance protein VanZ [Flagellimonas olearia]|uniref:Antibiotic resistance protein VanZ n=1 Tax=Flagellimonas olearia TaxID=552546 RepID=A0A6I1DW70_9FLAO|nr:VanZ family protein [Allomuricauda olearia]KAB7529230.1 antibiotic resistance protein VanZ [Allomuricauda olearia]
MLRKYGYTLLFIGWVLFITALSLFSFSEMDLDEGGWNIPYADKITHFVFYLVFGMLGCLFVRERTKGQMELVKASRLIFLVAVAYGIGIEVLQYTLTTDRMAEFGDVLANTFGAFVGISLVRWSFSKERPLKWKF